MIRKRLTYANVVASLSLFLVLSGGAAFAASQLAKNSVGTKQLKRNAVTAAKIKNGAVTGAKVKTATLGTVPRAASANSLAGFDRKGMVRASATAGGTRAEALAAAPELTLVSAKPFTAYAKCVSYGLKVEGAIFLKTTEDGSIFDSDAGELVGKPFFDTTTPEEKREVTSDYSEAGLADYYGVHSPEFAAMSPSGTVVKGEVQIVAKNGELPGGNGIFGPGNVCLFSGEMVVESS